FLSILRSTCSALFPYTTLFRSRVGQGEAGLPDRLVVGQCEHLAARDEHLPQRALVDLQRAGDDEALLGAQAPVPGHQVAQLLGADRKSTRLNSSHVKISYAVFC